MTPRLIISYIGKRIYREQYSILKNRILTEYGKIKFRQKKTHNLILERLLISGEDHRFRYHYGFDVIAILRALKNRLLHNKIEGASTIEQQLVRVLVNDYEKTLKRKIKEIFLSTTLREIVPRKDIPAIYLQVAYFGTEMNGIDQVYKRLELDNSQLISNEKCAEIIARIKYPEPIKNNERRLIQIEIRKNHLLSLYSKHISFKRFRIYG